MATLADLAEEPAVQLEVRGPPVPIIERYYTKHYAVDVNGHAREDFCVLQHSNRVCVVCLAPSHVLLSEGEILSVDYQIGKVDRRKNQVSGKRKRGGQKLTPRSPLCLITLKDGKQFILYSCVKAFLLETNENLITNPNLLLSKPLGEGYIAIVMSKLEDADKVCSQLLSEEQYKDALRDSTTGLKFWKVGSRKVFAVILSELERLDKGKGKRKGKEIIRIEDSDSDDVPTHLAGKKLKREDELMKEVKAIRHDLGAVFTLSKEMKLPPGLFKQLVDTFKCHICHSTPMNHPVIFARCCKSILGCESCVDAWFGGENGRSKSCPLCRAERAYSETCRLNGLDDFLTAIRPLLCDESSENPGPSASSYPFRLPPSPARPDSDDDFELPAVRL